LGNVGHSLLKVDPVLARDLAHEAAIWEPSNPITWSLFGRALEAEGDWHRAQAVYWHARRRFPHNVHSHSQLAHALVLHGDADLGEAVYVTAIGLFPGNPFCRNDLAHTLRITDRRERAVKVYRETQQHFPHNLVTLTGLADTLIDLNRFDEAEEVLVWVEQLGFDEKNAIKLNKILHSALDGPSSCDFLFGGNLSASRCT
jgi:Flp pilus assembly protein TadD